MANQIPPLAPLVLLEDEPISTREDDLLGLEPFARIVASAAIGTRGPFTIGVYADWGQGKTSVLRLAKSLVEEQRQDHIVTVWFNAWQFEREAHPIVPLVRAIHRAVEKRIKVKPKAKATRWLKHLKGGLLALLKGFEGTMKAEVVEATLSTEALAEYVEKVSEKLPPLPTESSLYDDSFEELREITEELGKAGAGAPKVVVFLDDLDRCLPNRALELLEGLKLVLGQPGFLFVLAVNQKVLEGYVQKQYVERYGARNYGLSGSSYMDKLVQLPLPLPSHRERFEQYFDRLLKTSALQAEANQEVLEALKATRKAVLLGSAENPRTLVRLVNTVIMDAALWLKELGVGRKEATKKLAICIVSRILQHHLPAHHYRVLVRSDELCKRILAHVKGPDSEPLAPKDGQDLKSLLPEERVAKEVMIFVEEGVYIREVLGTEAGRQWLTLARVRQEVDELVSPTREDHSDAIWDIRNISLAEQHEIARMTIEALQANELERRMAIFNNMRLPWLSPPGRGSGDLKAK